MHARQKADETVLNHQKLNEFLSEYKNDFDLNWNDEKFKWEAVQHFQDNWNIESNDFPGMLKESIAGCGKLLTSRNTFPSGMIVEFAEKRPEAVRSMFSDLFNESRDYCKRIASFKDKADEILHDVRGASTDRNHYQDEYAITTYLWLRYPDTYYAYKYSEAKSVSTALESDYEIKRGAHENNLRNHFALCDEIRSALRQGEELMSLVKNHLTSACYPDPEIRTLTSDVVFYISRANRNGNESYEWYPEKSAYNPGISESEWERLVNDSTVFTESALKIMQRIKDCDGEASCKQLSEKFGDSPNFYLSGSVALAKRVAARTKCPPCLNQSGNKQWWPILYLGRGAHADEVGSYVWRLRDELAQALDSVAPTGATEKHLGKGYGEKDFLAEVFMDADRYHRLCALLKRKKNVILQGAPGVGKTYCARRLAWSIMGEKDDRRIAFIQFHQNYSYEDFVMGYRHEGDSFQLRDGIFYRFCKKAEKHPDEPFFFIIDEVNRGNLSKIFGELLMLIEPDYRGHEATLVYTDEPFSVPNNLYLIGMMNTADRSLALIDYALRRRFSFFEMEPAFESEGFSRYRESLASKIIDTLVAEIEQLNHEIAQDDALGKGFCIGHSYFCKKPPEEDALEWASQIVDFDIMPLLNEYWFDDEEKLKRWDNILHGALRP